MGLQNVSGKNFCLLGFILHSANRKTNSEREVIVVLVTQDAEDNGKKNKGSSCCLNVKRLPQVHQLEHLVPSCSTVWEGCGSYRKWSIAGGSESLGSEP